MTFSTNLMFEISRTGHASNKAVIYDGKLTSLIEGGL